MSMRYAGMLTTTRVSVGIAFGPGSNPGLGSAVATVFVGSADADADGAGVAAVRFEEVEFWLFGSTVQPTRNADKSKISKVRFISIDSFSVAGATSVPTYLNEKIRVSGEFLHY